MALVERLQHMFSSCDGSEEAIGVGGPGEGLGVLVMLGDKAVGGGLEVDERGEDATLEAGRGECREEALHRVEPRRAGGREVEGPAGWRASQARTLGCLWVA